MSAARSSRAKTACGADQGAGAQHRERGSRRRPSSRAARGGRPGAGRRATGAAVRAPARTELIASEERRRGGRRNPRRRAPAGSPRPRGPGRLLPAKPTAVARKRRPGTAPAPTGRSSQVHPTAPENGKRRDGDRAGSPSSHRVSRPTGSAPSRRGSELELSEEQVQAGRRPDQGSRDPAVAGPGARRDWPAGGACGVRRGAAVPGTTEDPGD